MNMAMRFDNVQVGVLLENGAFNFVSKQLEVSRQEENINLVVYNGEKKIPLISITMDTEIARFGKEAVIITENDHTIQIRFSSIHSMKSFQFRLRELRNGIKSVFTDRTDESSAIQYFQFYGYLSQQQNMMQDYIRTSSYQQAMLANIVDFHDKVVLDVGAGSGILSFFAVQSGARKVYAIEASNMAQHCEMLVAHNNMSDRIIVIPGKVEEVEIPEQVDTIISEPMGYMLFNERMLESYLHAKKWLKPGGKMYPSRGDLHIAPFTDEALYMEQFSKANFWYQESFHGINLTCLQTAALSEYFRQPIVDTFDVRICLARSNKHTVDFQTSDETDLHCLEFPLSFTMLQSGLVHGLAFWFDVAFLGSSEAVWLSTSPTETLTHWYQVRCLVETPVLVKRGQTLTGKVFLRCNKRQSYDVDIELNIPGTTNKSKNTLDLKNPFFRYTGQQPQSPPDCSSQSPTDVYWDSMAPGQNVNYDIVMSNGIEVNNAQMLAQHGVVQNNLIAVSNVAPINPGSIPSVINLTSNSNSHRTSVGGGISPINFNQQPQVSCMSPVNLTNNQQPGNYSPSYSSQSQSAGTSNNPNVIVGGMGHFPVSNQFMIGDYVMPGNVVVPQQMNKSENV